MCQTRRALAYNQRLPGLIDLGFTRSEIAEDFGVSSDAVQRAAERRNLSISDRQTFRHKAEAMPPKEAVKYLLAVMDSLPIACEQNEHPVDVLPLTRMQRRVMVHLYENTGQVVSKEQIYRAMYFDRIAEDDCPDDNIVSVVICKIRKALPDTARITSVWGEGVKFEGKLPSNK